MKRSVTAVLALLLLAILTYVVSVSAGCRYCRSMSDRFFYALFGMDDTTRFSPGYSEGNFQRIAPGMSKAEVLRLVGEPLRKDSTSQKNFTEIWRFSQGSPDRNYWFRIVLFDSDGKVVSREAKYFVD